MACKTDISGRVAEAALALAATRKWCDVTPANIASEGDLILAQVLSMAGGKTKTLSEFARHIVVEVAKGTDLADLAQSARERLAGAERLMQRCCLVPKGKAA